MGLCISTSVVEHNQPPESGHAQQCPVSEATRRRIGASAVLTALIAAGVAAALLDPTGTSAAIAGLLISIVSLAAALFPDYFKEAGDCVYHGLQILFKLLHDLPRCMKHVKKALKEAWGSAWSAFCSGLQRVLEWARGVWVGHTSRETAERHLTEHFENFSREQYEELLLAAYLANERMQAFVDIARAAQQAQQQEQLAAAARV